jgi:hypothetical protein
VLWALQLLQVRSMRTGEGSQGGRWERRMRKREGAPESDAVEGRVH